MSEKAYVVMRVEPGAFAPIAVVDSAERATEVADELNKPEVSKDIVRHYWVAVPAEKQDSA